RARGLANQNRFLVGGCLSWDQADKQEKRKDKTLSSAAKNAGSHRDGSDAISENDSLSSGEFLRSFEGRPWSVTRLKSLYHFGFRPQYVILTGPRCLDEERRRMVENFWQRTQGAQNSRS